MRTCIIPIVIALLECSTGAYAFSSSHEVTEPPPLGRIRDIERLLGDKIPPDAAPRMIFEGDYGSVEVNLNDGFVCVVGGQAK